MTVSLLLLRPSTSFAATVILFCFFWGIAYMVFNLMLQFEIIRFAPQATTIAMAIYSGILNLGIGCGTMVGGVVCSSLSIAYIGYAGGIIGILAWRRDSGASWGGYGLAARLPLNRPVFV